MTSDVESDSVSTWVMRLVEGGSLDERLRHEVLRPTEAIELFAKIALALTLCCTARVLFTGI